MKRSTLFVLELEHSGDSKGFEYKLNVVVTSDVLRDKITDYFRQSRMLEQIEVFCREEIEDALNNIYTEGDE